jgi:hypothetical protein
MQTHKATCLEAVSAYHPQRKRAASPSRAVVLAAVSLMGVLTIPACSTNQQASLARTENDEEDPFRSMLTLLKQVHRAEADIRDGTVAKVTYTASYGMRASNYPFVEPIVTLGNLSKDNQTCPAEYAISRCWTPVYDGAVATVMAQKWHQDGSESVKVYVAEWHEAASAWHIRASVEQYRSSDSIKQALTGSAKRTCK